MSKKKLNLSRFYTDIEDDSPINDFRPSIIDYHMYKSPYSYFDAGTLPEVIITPPKDNAVSKAKQIFKERILRNQFYRDLNNIDADRRDYINKLYQIYLKSGSPKIKSTTSKENIVIPLYELISGGNTERANYSPMSNTMYVSPNDIIHDVEAEMSHAFQYYSKDYKNSILEKITSLPGDIKIKGKTGYERVGNIEHSAHSIVEPLMRSYLTDPEIGYDDMIYYIQDMREDPNTYFKNSDEK